MAKHLAQRLFNELRVMDQLDWQKYACGWKLVEKAASFAMRR